MLTREISNYAKEEAEVQLDYHNVFSTPEGMRVLTDMLVNWGFFSSGDQLANPALRDAAVWVLDRMGINHLKNAHELTEGLMRVPIVFPEQRSDE